MDEQYKDILKVALQEEITRIESHVAQLRAPASMEERSLIARYGKLLLVSQRLLRDLTRIGDPLDQQAVPRIEAILRREKSHGPAPYPQSRGGDVRGIQAGRP